MLGPFARLGVVKEILSNDDDRLYHNNGYDNGGTFRSEQFFVRTEVLDWYL